MDGLWDIKNAKKKILDRYFSREDQKKLLSMLQSHENTIYGQFCCINGNHSQGRWIEIRGKTITETKEDDRKIVGFVPGISMKQRCGN